MAQGTDLDLAPKTQAARTVSVPAPCEPSSPAIEGRWPLAATIGFAVSAALMLWVGIFAALAALGIFG